MKKKRDPYFSPMPGIMRAVLLVSAAGGVFFSLLYGTLRAQWMLTSAVSLGVTAYHMAIRFAAPRLLDLVFHRRYHPDSRWFRQYAWEPALYRVLRVQRWKKHIIAYDPREFSLSQYSLEEIVHHMCHAEAVHELIILLSLLSMLFAIPFGKFPVFMLTAVLAAMIDCTFVIMQRYNRPRIAQIILRRQKHAQTRKPR